MKLLCWERGHPARFGPDAGRMPALPGISPCSASGLPDSTPPPLFGTYLAARRTGRRDRPLYCRRRGSATRRLTMNQKALVTGGAGFIGSHIVDALLDQGMSVRVLDNLSTGSLDNLSHRRGEIEFIEGDLRDKDACYRACKGVETVFHQAALPSVPRSIADPITSNAVNVDGTLQML